MQSSGETILTIIAGVLTSIIAGPYLGALLIAFVAAFTRTAFENTCVDGHLNCFFSLTRYFAMSTGIAMFFVSVSGFFGWDEHVSVMAGGFFACFAEETIEFCKGKVKFVIVKIFKTRTPL